MLIRERIALSLLEQSGKPLSRTVFVKLMFLLRQETVLNNSARFYDFVPYNFGPFSFALYRDLERLEQNGYVSKGENFVELCTSTLDQTQKQTCELAPAIKIAVNEIYRRYGRMSPKALIRNVYGRYPWYATKSQLDERKFVPKQLRKRAIPAVYTVGYEGKSVDAFFNHLLDQGMEAIIDVRANPVSRKYGFSGLRMKKIGESLGLEYRHSPRLGVPSSDRASLSDFASYQHLLKRYELQILPQRKHEVNEVGTFMFRMPSVLVCVERDENCCHRSRLANAVANETGMRVIHL